MDYENEIFIDANSLDVEWLVQPELMLKYGKNEADCERTMDLTKEKLDLVKADLDKNIRESPDSFGITKITETVVSNTILMQDEYKEMYQAYLDAKYEHNVAKAAVRAFVQRKEALENLVKLHGQQYFAGPKVPRDLTAERNKKREMNIKANEKVSLKRTRKKEV